MFIAGCVCGEGGVCSYKHGDRKFDNFMRQIIWLSLFFNCENCGTETLNELAWSQNFSKCQSKDSNISSMTLEPKFLNVAPFKPFQ